MGNRMDRITGIILILVLAFGLSLASQSLPVFAQQNAPNNELLGNQRTVRGLVVAKTRIEYRSELAATILEAPYLEGMAFSKGDLLIKQDCLRLEAEQRAAKANADAAGIELRSKRRLFKLKAAGKDEYRLAAAQAKKSTSELEAHESRLRFCEFRAPFSGRIVQLNARVFEVPPNDRPLVVLINDEALDLEMVVPSNWILWLEDGESFRFKIDETGETLDASVLRIGAEVDPVSQTVKVYGRLTSKSTKVLAGMSGTASFAWQDG